MRARVRRTAACAPHGTTRPHDLPQKSGERRYTGVEPATPTIHSRGPANPSVWGSLRDVVVRLQDNSPLAATSQADHRRRPRRPARARSPRKHPDATGSSIVDGEPRCCTPRPAHAWCQVPGARCQVPGASARNAVGAPSRSVSTGQGPSAEPASDDTTRRHREPFNPTSHH